jgi:hypothetical protein
MIDAPVQWKQTVLVANAKVQPHAAPTQLSPRTTPWRRMSAATQRKAVCPSNMAKVRGSAWDTHSSYDGTPKISAPNC